MEALQMSVSNEKNKKEMKNLFLYSTGKTVSIFGTAIYNFALGLYVLKQTGSALSFAVTLILGIIPMVIINPFAGVIVDKVNKKTLVVCMDLLSGILLVSVYILCMKYELNLLIIYVTTFLLTVFTTFFGIGLEAAKPNIVSEKMLMNINSIGKIIDSISSIMGPMLGGIVFAIFDMRTFIIINGISFILSGLSMMFIHFKLFNSQSDKDHSAEKIHLIRDIKDGFNFLFERKSIKSMFMILILINFFLGFSVTVPLPYMINTVLKLGSKEFGMIQGAFPVGMILGALLVKKITERISYSILLKYISIALSILMILLGVPVMLKSLQLNSIVFTCYFIAVLFLFGLFIALIDIPLAYFMQKEIPDEYRGRVLSIGISIAKIMLPIAMISSGALLNILPSYVMPIAGGVLFFLLNVRSMNKENFELTSKNISV
ncbi:Major Facilitator Superfamily protein [Bacillus sp. 491mf]|uniref:MFS transporter n=1 Tax=Bacillus TaxID=1386 RepID=UPI000550F1E2|nr:MULTISPECIES: MFS transporter [unclassified Bacillus (in: firmicutes)]SFC58270.1 Major Facilitator Superfamily protein [Bacillus sp. 491mf]